MPNPALTAILGIDPSSFLKGISASEASLQELDRAFKLSAANVASFEQSLKGGGTAEQLAQLEAMRAKHRELGVEVKNTTRQMAAFQAAADLAPKEAGPKPPDDSERYAAYWKRMEEQERSQRAHQAMAAVPTPATDDSAAYEAHWKKLEEQQRSERAHEAMAASGAASDAAQKDKLEKLKQFQRERDALVKELRAREENDRNATPSPASRSSRGEGGEHEEGEPRSNNRMRDQELAHSARSVVDMLAAGIDPMRALEMEGPRLVQAFGGGLPALLGIGGAIAGVSALISKTVELTVAANELHRGFDLALNNDTTQGQQSIEALRKRVAELDAQLAEAPPVTGAISRFKQGVGDFLASTGMKIQLMFDAISGRATIGEIVSAGRGAEGDRNAEVAEAQKQRAEKLKQIVAAEKEINNLQEEGFHHGQDAVRVAGLELERKNKIADVEAGYGIPKLRQELKDARTPEEKDRLQRELDDKGEAEAGGIDEVNREFDIKVKVAQIEVDQNAINRASASMQAGLGHVNMTNPDGTANHTNLPPGFADHNVGLQHRLADRDAKMADLEAAEKGGGDTTKARLALDQSEAALRDAAVEEARKTPRQHRKDADDMRDRQQAEGRLAHPGTYDADRGEHPQNFNGADANGSVIPNADVTGGNAYSNPDNVNSGGFDAYFRKNPAPASIADHVRNGSHNAAKSDAKTDQKDLIKAIDNPQWTKDGNMFKNR